MNIKRRVDRAEATAGAKACPCRTSRRIEIVEGPSADGSRDSGPCGLCGSPRAVRVIEAVRPEGGRP